MSNLFKFSFKALTTATERLVKAHPYSQERIQSPKFIKKHFPNVVKTLRHKIREADPSNLRQLALSLNLMEQTLLPVFHLEREAFIRHRSLIMVRHQHHLAKPEPLKRAFAAYGTDHDEGPLIAELLMQTRSQQPLDPYWTSLVEHRRQHKRDFALKFVDFISQRRRKLSDLFEQLDIDTNSQLASYLGQAIYVAGPKAWHVQGVSIAIQAFEKGDLNQRAHGLKIAYRDRNEASDIAETVNLFISEVGDIWPKDDDLRRHMKRHEPDIWRWLNDLFLHSFFESEWNQSNNERYLFWRHYLGSMSDLHINMDAGRIFMDFERFGLVEFLQTNNALYVYESMDFQHYLTQDKKHPTWTHDRFKSTSRALERWSHNKRWKGTFTYQLRTMDIHPS